MALAAVDLNYSDINLSPGDVNGDLKGLYGAQLSDRILERTTLLSR
jgi:hypothetical protein